MAESVMRPASKLPNIRFFICFYLTNPKIVCKNDVEAGEEFGALESVKASSDLISPVSGKVVEVNEALEDTPELVNEDAFAAWIIKVEMADAAELEALLDAAGYKALIGE